MKPQLAAAIAKAAAAALGATTRCDGLLNWAKTYLPNHTERPFSGLHRWLAMQLDAADQHRGAKINLLGPRGSAKSTIGTLAYPLRCACEATEPYIWILSDTKSQAAAHLENIREELRTNDRLRARYGEAALRRRGTWNANRIALGNGTVIESYGTGQRLRGRRRGHHRPTLIVCDDLQNDSHTYSALQRSTSRAWFFSVVMKAGRTKTNVVNLGTSLHREAIAMELMDTPGWTAHKFGAVRTWPERMDLWAEWESIYRDNTRDNPAQDAKDFFLANQAAMEAGAAVLWPEEEPLYRLMRMRAEDMRPRPANLSCRILGGGNVLAARFERADGRLEVPRRGSAAGTGAASSSNGFSTTRTGGFAATTAGSGACGGEDGVFRRFRLRMLMAKMLRNTVLLQFLLRGPPFGGNDLRQSATAQRLFWKMRHIGRGPSRRTAFSRGVVREVVYKSPASCCFCCKVSLSLSISLYTMYLCAL